MCSLLSLPDKAMAWSSLNLRSSLKNNWSGTNDDPFTKNGDENKWKKEIDVSSLNADFFFRIYVSDDGGKQIYPKSDPTEISVGSSTSDLNFNANSTDNSWKISNPSSKYSKITIYAEYSNVWTIKVEGTPKGGGAEPTYKLMLKTNTTGSEPGTEVATFTGSKFPYTATYDINSTDTYYFYVNDGTKDYLHEGQTFSNGKDVTIFKYGETNNQYHHAVKLETSTTGTYTFTFNQSGSDYTLRCDYPASTSSDAYYLPNSGNNNFAINDNCKFVDGTLTLNLTAGFKFKVCKKTGSSENWYGDGSTISATTTDKSITSNTGDMTLTVTQPGTYTFKVEEISNGVKLSVTYPTSTHTVNVTAGPGGNVTPNGDQPVGTEAVSITAIASDGYVFEKWTASSTGIKIADAYSASTTFTATASGTVTANFTATSSDPIYYVVFPDANVGNTARADKTAPNIPTGHTAFRLIPSRNRNAVTLDKDLVSINLKIDGNMGRQLRYDTNGEIKFYIIDNSGKYFKTDALTRANDYLQAKETTKANNNVDYYDTRSSLVWSEQPSFYYTIHKNDAQQAKSLTFMFSRYNKSDKDYIFNKGESAKQLDPAQPSNSVDGFTDGEIKSGNLIVGFLTSRGHGSTYYTNHISKGVYLVGQMNGTSYTVDKNYEMKKILYPLDVTDEAKADSIVYSYTVKKGNGADWNDFFLSFSTGDKIDDGKLWNLLLRPSVQNQMDGQALEGGVTFFKDNDGEDNTQQALNPLLSDEQKRRYVSYTIYFNATYSTYRIEFHDGFYIAGEALEESGSYAPEKRIAMSKADLNGVEHYIYTGKFFQGKKFAFFLNENTYTLNYCEDGNPVSEPLESATAWDVQAPANGADYAFYNRVLYNKTGDNTNHTLGDGKSGMTWGLPTGTYTIRFYNHKEEAGNNQLYTVDKEVLMANVTSTFKESEFTSEKVHNYGGWRTLSDDCALILPNGVKAYYAANVGNGKVYLKELTDGYIPAHCPVILSNPNLLAGTKNIAFPVRPDGYDVRLADSEQNYLVDCYEKKGTVDPEVTENGTKKYNYFFSYTFKFEGSKVKSNVPLGFWKPFAGTATKKNYSYLSIDTQLNPSRYDEDTYTFNYSDTEPVVSSKAYCFVMAFDEDELGDNTTTGIEQVKENAEVDMTNAVWHNMQGVRITKPSAPGMYICNGKKVVVR